MKNAEGFKFMKSQKASGHGGRGQNNPVMTGARPYFNRDGGKFGGQKWTQGQGNIIILLFDTILSNHNQNQIIINIIIFPFSAIQSCQIFLIF